jgi:ectoine hydroxylase-related dioxygenase (phytanoyl-CoA dioxygenase family)
MQPNNHEIGVNGVHKPTMPIPRVKASDGAEKILNAMHDAGGVIIEEFLSQEQVDQLEKDVDGPFNKMQQGSLSQNEILQEFHGLQTKRITNLVTYSKIFREDILDMDLVHSICEEAFKASNSCYWMTSAQGVEIGPGNRAQFLHRDQSQYACFDLLGPTGPEAVINFFISITTFTEENGATRVIPGSQKWGDFSDLGTPEMTVPVLMKRGDCMLMSGKTVHGGGSNVTKDVKRRALGFAMCLGYLTPEEAYPFQITNALAKTMSPRAQRMIGYRSVYPTAEGALWQCDYAELANYIGMDS